MRYRFGDHVLDTETRELLAGSTPIEIEPQVFDVLVHLLANRDRVVAKEELLDAVWGDRFVSESALTTRIKQARQAVGDSGQRQDVIKTSHGRGYRFVADVTEDDSANEASSPTLQAAVGSIPRTRYAEAEGATIAYQTFGDGPDLVFIAGFTTNLEVQWEHPGIAAFLRRLGSFARVTILDKRGVGLSERLPRDDPPSLETRADDLMVVMDAASVERATVLGSSEGGSLTALFAASHPERVERLVLHNTWVVGSQIAAAQRVDVDTYFAAHWGKGATLAALGPSLGADPSGRALLARLERQSATPRGARHLLQLSWQIDITPVLGAIAVPTLVMHRVDDDIVAVSQGAELAAGIPGAVYVELPGADHWIFSGRTDQVLDPIEEFVTGAPATPRNAERQLATVLFVDIVESTTKTRELGDHAWSSLLDEFDAAVAAAVADHRGELVKTTGDGVVATFDAPGRAVQAACAVRSAAAPLGLAVRCGLHTAEIERRGHDIAGIGVHIASRVAEAAAPGEVWVSRTVTDLVAGTGLRFADRGTHALKGLDQPWALFAVQL